MTGLKQPRNKLQQHTISGVFFRTVSAAFISLAVLGVSALQACEPTWHNQVSVEQGALSLNDGKHAFTVNAEGKLYFGVHRVALSAEQQQVLLDYHQLMVADLTQASPVSASSEMNADLCQKVAKRQQQEQHIQSTIPALKAWRSVTL
ncbi:hypothetical protein [Photobacterium kagoshimensis]|uniref:hypothetical protein n=1 Tax=Photobacterium kagoshimensis TaxID=2910242 RepID=UPI003D0D3948